MAVIIKDFGMPSSCENCDLHNYHFCDITTTEIEKYYWEGGKPNDCPLRSADEYVLRDGEEWKLHYKNAFNDGFVEASKQDARILKNKTDEMIAEIKKLSNANPSYWNTCDVVDREDVLEIIHKYCDKENTDGSNNN